MTAFRQSSMYRSALYAYHLFCALTCVALLLLDAPAAQSQIPSSSRPLPLGTLIDVGGYRVHLYCIGQGSPTVMIVGGAFSVDWGLVQPEVAKFTRVCTFDPSGTAWSDPFEAGRNKVASESPSSAPGQKSMPTCEDRVDEIRRLIVRAPIHGPYVLVGFSVGALWERIYAAEYPDNIIGMVVVDHAFQGWEGPKTASHAAASNSSPSDYRPPVLISKAPFAIGFEDDSNFSKLPEHDQELHNWAISQGSIRVDYPMVAGCFSLIKKVTKGHSFPLGHMPVVVISTPNETPGYAELQATLLALSRDSKHIIAWNSTHMVPIDEPEVIVRAIQGLLN